MANQVLTVNISEEVRSVRSEGSWAHGWVQEMLALFMPIGDKAGCLTRPQLS